VGKDISKLLSEWPFGAGGNVRRVTGDDGREKVQIRVCLDTFHGLLQFECDGRPDGKRPQGKEFYLDRLEEKMRQFIATGGDAEKFRLTHAQCRKLFDESSQVYHRYVVLLQLGDFDRVIRDTARNMRLFRFVNRHAMHASDREHLECWWPYILRIHYTAVTMQHLSAGRLEAGLDGIKTCRDRLRELIPQENDVFKNEMKRSGEALEQMEKEVRERLPLTELEKLEKEKSQAIREQRYEDAARLRDRIRSLKSDGTATAEAETSGEQP
jgi:hypothetical protein